MEKEEEEEEVVETPATPLPEELQAVVVEVVKEEEKIPVTEEDVEEVMENLKPKLEHLVFYYWPVIPKEHCQRWEVNKAVMQARYEWIRCRIPPPPPDASEQDDVKKVGKRSLSLWNIFKRKQFVECLLESTKYFKLFLLNQIEKY